jgi:hypothetical protein
MTCRWVSLAFGGLHLTEALWPGLGLPLPGLGRLGLVAPFLAPPERRMPLKLIAGFSLLWYVVHELTPLKLFPDVSRYMLTLAPLLCILAAAFVYELFQRRDPRPVVAAVTVIAAAIPALCTSVRINGTAQDPRAVVPDPCRDQRAHCHGPPRRLTHVSLRASASAQRGHRRYRGDGKSGLRSLQELCGAIDDGSAERLE